MYPENWAIGVDLGGTNIDVAQVDHLGKIYHRLRVPTDATRGPVAVEDKIRTAIAEICSINPDSKPIGMGIGVAGQIEPHSGLVKFAPNLGWQNFPLLQNLKDSLKISGVSMNDVRAAAWGEWLFGAGKGSANMVCMFVGTGVGGGIVVDGKMINGFCNSAGEIGHMTVDMHGPSCHCGNTGCLEAIAGGWAIERAAREAIQADPIAGKPILEMVDNDIKKVNARIVAEATKAGIPLAVQIIENASEALIAGAVSIVNSFNPECLVLGGGVIEGIPSLIEKIREGINKRALPEAASAIKVVHAQLKNDSGVVGAAAIAIHSFANTN